MAKAKRTSCLNCKLKLFIVPKAFKVREKAGPEPQLMYLQSDHLCICKDNLSQFEHSPTVPLFDKSMTMADLQFVALDLVCRKMLKICLSRKHVELCYHENIVKHMKACGTI